jgi:hypothetical protein
MPLGRNALEPEGGASSDSTAGGLAWFGGNRFRSLGCRGWGAGTAGAVGADDGSRVSTAGGAEVAGAEPVGAGSLAELAVSLGSAGLSSDS